MQASCTNAVLLSACAPRVLHYSASYSKVNMFTGDRVYSIAVYFLHHFDLLFQP